MRKIVHVLLIVASTRGDRRKDDDRLLLRYGSKGQDELSAGDRYAGAWLQRAEDFIKVDTDAIGNLEGATWAYVTQPKIETASTRDWFDFCIEHLSVWWKTAGLHHKVVKDTLKYRLEAYVNYEKRGRKKTSRIRLFPNSTLTIIPFVSGQKMNDELAALLLEAVILSTTRHFQGQLFIFLIEERERDLMIAQKVIQEVTPFTTGTIFGLMPLSIPNGVGSALPRLALETVRKNQVTAYFEWIYYTEADLILHGRRLPRIARTLRHAKKFLQRPTILVPHRMQALPSPHDFTASSHPDKDILHAYDANITRFFVKSASCCDAGQSRPGIDKYEKCGNFWYHCGRQNQDTLALRGEKPNERIQHYGIVQFQDGTGLSVINANEHGRRCYLVNSGRPAAPIAETPSSPLDSEDATSNSNRGVRRRQHQAFHKC